jgi:hypothetical protein
LQDCTSYILEMDKKLLTPAKIRKINHEASFSILNNPGFLSKFTKGRLDIFSITPVKKLIFIEGDSFTGLAHINMRHRFFTNAHSKIRDDSFVRTSRFAKDKGTLMDYIHIAESLYDPSNMDVQNSKPETFEVFKGKADNSGMEYRLVIYHGTRIIHTLFPIEKKKASKKFEKMDIVSEWYDRTTLVSVIPYFGVDQILRYGIGVLHHTGEQLEEWKILIYENGEVAKQVELGKMQMDYNFDIGTRLQQINYADVSKYEAIIEKIEKGEIK